jgi:hypothetical protein
MLFSYRLKFLSAVSTWVLLNRQVSQIAGNRQYSQDKEPPRKFYCDHLLILQNIFTAEKNNPLS